MRCKWSHKLEQQPREAEGGLTITVVIGVPHVGVGVPQVGIGVPHVGIGVPHAGAGAV
jgi:hypothetical protein